PVELKVFLLKFGGKMPAAETGEIPVKKGRGSAPGYMEMVEVTDLTPEQGQVFKAYWIARAAQVLDAWTE
ncbi:MAG: hypothetical protein U1D67_08400, partial [Dehalococcoidia bacterium]|nr:hypothetical protein [Dehalococcoidia bacterium]